MSWLSKIFGGKKVQDVSTINEKANGLFDSTQSNLVKIFVSSTFKDLEEERSCLATKVFPRLRNFCYKKGLSFQDLDLRWGITEEESKNGQVVRLCLKGIDDSVPYFICILGDRYGWIPSENDINLGDNQIYKDFIKEQVENERSITEIEIKYALLHKERIKPFFFFKLSSSISKHDERMRSLKKEIELKFPESVFYFSTPDELSNEVYDIVTKDIEEKYPKFISSSDLQEEIQNDINTWKKLSESMMILSSFDKCHAQLDKVLTDKIRMIWITSNNDSNHRYVSADWMKSNEKEYDIFYFNCQNTLSKINSYDVLWKIYQRVCYINSIEIVLTYNSKENEIYSPTQELYIELEKVCKNIRIYPVFIIDNIDNCDDFSPRTIQVLNTISEKLHFILLSTISFYEKHGNIPIFAHHHIPKLSSDELSEYIAKYLAQYGKKLDSLDCHKLACNELLNDLQLLKLALDILRQYASFDNFKTVFEHICDTKSKIDLYRYALSLIKLNYLNRDSLMGKVLGLIIESPIGLTMTDLRILTGVSPFAIYEIIDILSQFLSYQDEEIKVLDQSFACAAKEVFLLTESEIDNIDQRLVTFWETEKDVPDEKCAIYGLTELYIKNQNWDKLFNILANPTYFYYYLNNAQDLFFSRWNILKNHSSVDGHQYTFPIYHIKHSTLDKKNAESLAWSYLSIFQTALNFTDEESVLVYLEETKALIKNFGLDKSYLESVLFAFYSKHYIKQNKFDDALLYANMSLNIREDIYQEDNEFVLKAKELLYKIYNLTGNISEINKLVSNFETIISSSREIPTEQQINLLTIIIDYYKKNAFYRKIKEYSKVLIETTKKYYTPNSIDYIMSIYNYCDNLNDINEVNECYSYIKEIIEGDYFKQLPINNIKIAFIFYYIKVRVSLKIDFDVSNELHSLLTECPDNIESKEFILSNGVHLLIECGRFDMALEWSNKEIDLCQSNQHIALGSAYERKGGIFHYTNKPMEALEFLFKAESEYLKSGTIESVSNLANLYSSIGSCYAQMADKRCINYLQKSIDVSEGHFGKSGYNLALRYKNLGMAYMYVCKEYRQSLLPLEQAANLYKESDSLTDVIDVFRLIVEASHKAGYFRETIEKLSLLPPDEKNQEMTYALMQDVQNCANCLELIKEFRQYGANNFNALSTIRMLTSEFFIACYQAGLNPIIEESGQVFVYLEGREYHYTPVEQFCDTVIIRSKINNTEITDEELSNINAHTISEIIDKETVNHNETFTVYATDNGSYTLLSTFRLGEIQTFRDDCINVLNIATIITRRIEAMTFSNKII